MTSARSGAVWLIAAMFLCAATGADAQDKPCPTNVALVVAAPTLAYVTCELGTRVFAGGADVFDLTAQGDDPTAPPSFAGRAALTILAVGNLKFTSVAFSIPLTGGHNYVLSVRAVTAAERLDTLSGVWSPIVPAPGATWGIQHVRFSTKAGALLVPTAGDGNKSFFLVSPIGIRPCSVAGQPPQAPILVEQPALAPAVRHPAVMRRQSLLSIGEMDRATPACELPLPGAGGTTPQFNPARIGMAEVWLRRGAFRQASVLLNIEGVVDSFGQTLSVPQAKRKLTVGAVPKAKDDSTYYLKVAHEAAEGAKPAFSLDTKLAPVFDHRVLRYFDPTVKLDADVGLGELKGKETTKTTNTIKLGAGLTAQFTNWRFTPVASFEADRDFTQKKNLIAEPDVNVYMPWMNHGRAVRSRRAYVARLANTPPEKWEEIDENSVEFRMITGFAADITLGVETGGALKEGKVENDAKTSAVKVPTHGIFRARPKFQSTVEIWRFSLTGNLTPRYVAVTEPVGELVDGVDPTTGAPGKVAALKDIHGWRIYGEASVQYAIDRSGHIAFATTYKRGSAPPTYADVNTFQSGLTIKY